MIKLLIKLLLRPGAAATIEVAGGAILLLALLPRSWSALTQLGSQGPASWLPLAPPLCVLSLVALVVAAAMEADDMVASDPPDKTVTSTNPAARTPR